MPLQGELAVERMCQLAQVSRAGFYRYLGHKWSYGYRRVAEELRARGMIVNHKRIARIMREDNLGG